MGVFRAGDKNKGYVKVYSKQGGANWSTMQEIDGKGNWNRFGFSVDLSNSGSIMAITSRNRTAFVYQLSGSTSQYEEIFSEDCKAREVAVSPDGSVIDRLMLHLNCLKNIPKNGIFSIELYHDIKFKIENFVIGTQVVIFEKFEVLFC